LQKNNLGGGKKILRRNVGKEQGIMRAAGGGVKVDVSSSLLSKSFPWIFLTG
jgi:hypothetical protein